LSEALPAAAPPLLMAWVWIRDRISYLFSISLSKEKQFYPDVTIRYYVTDIYIFFFGKNKFKLA
jgi:hypothetical protein